MTELLFAAQMRAIEQAAIDSGSVTGLELMERAGAAVVEAIIEAWPDLGRGTHRAVVLCGPGNNGGDGFVIARQLRARDWTVHVFAWGWDVLLRPGVSRIEKTPDARHNGDRWISAGGVTESLQDDGAATALAEALSVTAEHIVIIDALLGIGQDHESDTILRPFWQGWDEVANRSLVTAFHRVAVDVPTGYDTDTGALLGAAPFEPDLTVTFHAPKPVHTRLEQGGYPVVVKDIGL